MPPDSGLSADGPIPAMTFCSRGATRCNGVLSRSALRTRDSGRCQCQRCADRAGGDVTYVHHRRRSISAIFARQARRSGKALEPAEMLAQMDTGQSSDLLNANLSVVQCRCDSRSLSSRNQADVDCLMKHAHSFQSGLPGIWAGGRPQCSLRIRMRPSNVLIIYYDAFANIGVARAVEKIEDGMFQMAEIVIPGHKLGGSLMSLFTITDSV